MAVFGERLVEARKALGLTQYTLAEKLDVPRSTISGYETEGKEAPYATLIRISTVLGVSTDYLTGKSDERMTPKQTVIMKELSELQKAYDTAHPSICNAVDRMLGDVYAILAVALKSENMKTIDACSEFMTAARRMIEIKV